MKDEKGDLVADCFNTLARWRKSFSQLLNVHGVNDVRLYTNTYAARGKEVQAGSQALRFGGAEILKFYLDEERSTRP